MKDVFLPKTNEYTEINKTGKESLGLKIKIIKNDLMIKGDGWGGFFKKNSPLTYIPLVFSGCIVYKTVTTTNSPVVKKT